MRRPLITLFLLLFATTAFAAPVTVEWDPNPPEEQVTHYCVQVNGTTVEPCVTATEKDLDANIGDVLTVTAHNAAGLSSLPSDPVTVPGVTSPGSFRFKVTVTVEVQ